MSVSVVEEVPPEPIEADRSFEAHDEQFFLSEGSLAPTALIVSAIDPLEDEPMPLSRAERLASPRRRALARWVGGVVAAFAIFCVAAFATKSVPTPARAAAFAPSPPPPPPALPVTQTPVVVIPPAALPPSEPGRATALREVARAALSRGALDTSIERGFESVELDPSDAEAWLILGAAQMAKGKNVEARSTFTACTKIATLGPRNECFQMLQ